VFLLQEFVCRRTASFPLRQVGCRSHFFCSVLVRSQPAAAICADRRSGIRSERQGSAFHAAESISTSRQALMQDFSNRVFLLAVSPNVATGLCTGLVFSHRIQGFEFLRFLLYSYSGFSRAPTRCSTKCLRGRNCCCGDLCFGFSIY
jgi:hypothetical protein